MEISNQLTENALKPNEYEKIQFYHGDTSWLHANNHHYSYFILVSDYN